MHYAGYTEDEVEPVALLMVDYLARPVIHDAFFKKYASKKFLKGMLFREPMCLWTQLTLIPSFHSGSTVGQAPGPHVGYRRRSCASG